MELFVVIAYDTEGKPHVYADFDNVLDANLCAIECDGVVRTVEV
jgi:hypothetical protein